MQSFASSRSSATLMEPAKAAEVIRMHADASKPLTVSDAAAQTGLALRDAESGLTWLSTEYRGQLRVTSEGQLVHVFPTGFTKPWAARDARAEFLRVAGRGALSAVRFVVRAWVAVTLVGYAAVFVALLLAMTFARQGNDSRRSGNDLPGGALAYALLRVVSDALFWTFHPWSPFSVASGYSRFNENEGGRSAFARSAQPRGPRVPLYERVNRFFFGPTQPEASPLDDERRLIGAIRAGKGRIGLADVMRVTGLERDRADPLMAKLMLDYDGDVDVSEDGGIVYRFPELRKTATQRSEAEPEPVWARKKPLPPLTGNPMGTNLAIIALNGFNLFMGLWGFSNGLTLERAAHLFDRIPYQVPSDGTPVVLGIVPVVFSSLLFALPLVRLAARPARLRREVEERGRLAVLRAVLERVRQKQPVNDKAVADAWRVATGRRPDEKRLNRHLVALGGDVAIDPEGRTRWRFADLETEAAAVEAERDAASEDEARLGRIVFATDEN